MAGIRKRFSTYSLKDVEADVEDQYGVYEIAGPDGTVLYVGEGRVRDRLRAHLKGSAEPIVGASKYRVEYTGAKAKAEQRKRALLVAHEKESGAMPRHNQRR